MRLAPLFAALCLTTAAGLAPPARAATPITLTQAMADPDWIGPPVELAWWRWDGKAAQYALQRDGATVRDTWEVGVDGGIVSSAKSITAVISAYKVDPINP